MDERSYGMSRRCVGMRKVWPVGLFVKLYPPGCVGNTGVATMPELNLGLSLRPQSIVIREVRKELRRVSSVCESR